MFWSCGIGVVPCHVTKCLLKYLGLGCRRSVGKRWTPAKRTFQGLNKRPRTGAREVRHLQTHNSPKITREACDPAACQHIAQCKSDLGERLSRYTRFRPVCPGGNRLGRCYRQRVAIGSQASTVTISCPKINNEFRSHHLKVLINSLSLPFHTLPTGDVVMARVACYLCPFIEVSGVARPTRFPGLPLQRRQRRKTENFDRAPPPPHPVSSSVSKTEIWGGVCKGVVSMVSSHASSVCPFPFAFPAHITENATDVPVRGAIQLGRRRREVHCGGRERRKRGEGDGQNAKSTHPRWRGMEIYFCVSPSTARDKIVCVFFLNKCVGAMGQRENTARAHGRVYRRMEAFSRNRAAAFWFHASLSCRPPWAHVKILDFLCTSASVLVGVILGDTSARGRPSVSFVTFDCRIYQHG